MKFFWRTNAALEEDVKLNEIQLNFPRIPMISLPKWWMGRRRKLSLSLSLSGVLGPEANWTNETALRAVFQKEKSRFTSSFFCNIAHTSFIIANTAPNGVANYRHFLLLTIQSLAWVQPCSFSRKRKGGRLHTGYPNRTMALFFDFSLRRAKALNSC